ncbi:thymidylate synthase [Amycolatopsis orientalis]|uniref:thymidylate synthase n=1 Tax=Amycolatopsis orientalis TaxID=31958 RepID=UPI0004272B82|nr:thymidylate synthase [Amycolatopsis orientalis]
MSTTSPPVTRSLSPASFLGFHDAYAAVLAELVDARSRISTRGNAGPEQLNVSFQLENPAARLPLYAARKANVVFNLAEVLWFLGGRDDLAMMRYYAPRMASYSADGVTIDGAAYGTRLFRAPGPGGRSPFDATLDLIRTDPDTKRAVLPIFGAHEVGDADHPDVSCTIAFQLLKRGDQLHAVCYMRANDAFQGLVSDVFSFTVIHELAARLLGLELGTYTHHTGSMHIGDQHLPKARAIVAEAQHQQPPTFPVPVMPPETTRDMIAEVCTQEAQLRANRTRHTRDSLAGTGLPIYWQRLVALLDVHRRLVHHPDEPIDDSVLAFLDAAHLWLLRHKWPALAASADQTGHAS